MNTKRIAFGVLLATIGLLAAVGVAAGAAGASPPAQEGSVGVQTEQEGEDGWLGIVVTDISQGLTIRFELAATSGAVVLSVHPKSPAEAAGLKPGDVVQSVNGQAIADAEDLRDALEDLAPGAEVSLGLMRGAQSLTIQATLGEKPKVRKAPTEQGNPLPGFLNDLGRRLVNGSILSGEFQVLGEDGTVHTVTLTSGKVVGVTDTTLTIVRKDNLSVSFTTSLSDTRVIVGGHRINLAGLRVDTPVLVVEKDGVVTLVLAWPGEYLGKDPGHRGGPAPGPRPLDVQPFAQIIPGELREQLAPAPPRPSQRPEEKKRPQVNLPQPLPPGQLMERINPNLPTGAFQEQLKRQMEQGKVGVQAQERAREMQKQMEQQVKEQTKRAQEQIKERAKRAEEQLKEQAKRARSQSPQQEKYPEDRYM
ncbi:MAG: PDZ domain-containing protein [Chloroflexi bacterium]|nr:PDZ domain-containing protein [Chloroflexota bacterium]